VVAYVPTEVLYGELMLLQGPLFYLTELETECIAQRFNRPRTSVFHNKIELHIDSFAKYAAVFLGCRAPS